MEEKNGRKFFANYIYDKGLVSRVYKELPLKRKITQFKNI